MDTVQAAAMRSDGLAHSLSAASHTPDSFARAVLSAVVRQLAQGEGPLDDRTLRLKVSIRPLEQPTNSPEVVHPVLPAVSICVHLPGGETDICAFWPPFVTY